MKGTCYKGQFRRMLGVALTGLLVLSLCATVSYAEQIEVTPDEEVTDEAPVVEVQGAGDEGFVVGAQDASITWDLWDKTDSLPEDPGNYRLMYDVNLTSTWNVPHAVTTRLDLNGKKITLNQNGEANPVISVKQSALGAHCDFVLYDEGGNEGTISHGENKPGSGVWVGSGCTFTMKGGTISNNDSTIKDNGGGVAVEGGTFTMEGGTISNNKGDNGSGVAVEGGTFTMIGGTIQNNGNGDTKYGGGVYVRDSTFNLSGGTITKNTARRGGGVACVFTYQATLSGNPQVTDNRVTNVSRDPMGDNLCLVWPKRSDGNPLSVSGAFGENAKIGISIIRDISWADHQEESFEYIAGVFTTGYKAAQSTDPWNYFTSDGPGLDVLWTPDNNEAQLTVARHITVAQGITGGTVKVSKSVAAEGETVTIQTTTNEGWELLSVTAKDADGNPVTVKDNKEIVVPASNVVVSATFRKIPAPADVHVTYTAHVQRQGDLPAVSDGEVAGTTGNSCRLEAISATVNAGGIEYRAHIQGEGWSSWAANGKQTGTAGESRSIEAIQMRLTGPAATDGHHVWYRVHSQTYGWLGWTCDGEPAGTAGMSKRAEAYQVVVLRGNAKPDDYDASKPAYRAKAVANAHLQRSGWTGKVYAGMVGTTGQSKRLEGIRLYAPNQPFAGGITYQVHEQGNGWTAQKSNGALAGTTGKSRRIEAVRISLTGELANHLSVWYRVHSQTYGWLGWACDGTSAGTEGLAKRAEAVEIQILPKGAPAPGSTANALRTR